MAAKIDVVDSLESVAYDIVNGIEKEIRQALPDKKIYIYIEVDKYDINYHKKAITL